MPSPVVTAIVALVAIVASVGPTADAAVSHSRPSPGSGRVYDVAGTVTLSGHGTDALIAGTTVATAPDGGCSGPTRYLRSTDSFRLSGHGTGPLGAAQPRTNISARLLGLAGTTGCSTTGEAGASFACTASPTLSGLELGHVVGDRIKLTLYTTIVPGTERPTDGEPCTDSGSPVPVPVLPSGAYLEIGGTFTFSLSQIERTHTASVIFNSEKDRNCVGGELALPAHATVCVDPTNAKSSRCTVFAVPPGGSASCAITNDWTEKVSFHLSRVCTEIPCERTSARRRDQLTSRRRSRTGRESPFPGDESTGPRPGSAARAR